jgi:hypothetical protein
MYSPSLSTSDHFCYYKKTSQNHCIPHFLYVIITKEYKNLKYRPHAITRHQTRNPARTDQASI